MEDFPKNIKIEVALNNPCSIKAALQRYASLLNSKEAFRDNTFSTFLDVEFVTVVDGELPHKFQLADVGTHRAILDECFSINGERYIPKSEVIDFGDEWYASEALFFAHALQFSELKEEIIITAKAMVNYARAVNNTSDMWADDMHVFGLEALYILARVYEDCCWLLASFHIPYWDFEHVLHSGDYISAISSHYGWTHETIKAYIWCDEPSMRKSFFGHIDCGSVHDTHSPTLYAHLTENPEDYEYFQQTMIARLQTEPVLAYTDGDDEEESSVILPFFTSMQARWTEGEMYHDEEVEDIIQQHFLTDTLENEVNAFEARIKEVIKTPLYRLSQAQQLSKEQDTLYRKRHDYAQGEGIDIVREFIEESIEFGAELWDYIQHGNNPDILDNIEPVDIKKLVKQKPLRFGQLVNWHVGGTDSLKDELHCVLAEYCIDIFRGHDDDEEDETEVVQSRSRLGTILNVFIGGKEATPENTKPVPQIADPGAQLLRTLDVFKALIDEPQMAKGTYTLVVSDYELLDDDAFDLRYNNIDESAEDDDERHTRHRNTFIKLIHDIYDFKVEHEHIAQFDRLVEKARTSLVKCPWNKEYIACYALAAHQLRKDFDNDVSDELTQRLFDFISADMFEPVLKELFYDCELAEHYQYENEGKDVKRGMSEDDMTFIRQHFTDIAPQGDEASARAHVLRILQKHLETRDKSVSALQPSYQLFSRDDAQREIMVCYRLLKRVPVTIQPLLARLFTLYVDLAPQRIITHIVKMETEDADANFDDVIKRIDFFDELVKLDIPRADVLAYQAVNAIEDDGKNEGGYDEGLIAIYSEINSSDNSMFGAIDKKKAIDLEQGLQKVSQRRRIAFYQRVQQQYPEFEALCTADIDDVLQRYIKENICVDNISDMSKVDQYLSDSFALIHQHIKGYLAGDVDLSTMLSVYQSHCAAEPSDVDHYQGPAGIEDIVWALPSVQRDRLVEFLANQSVQAMEFAGRSFAKSHADGYEDEQQEELLAYYQTLNISAARLIEYSLSCRDDVFEQYLIKQAKTDEFYIEMAKQSAANKLRLLEIFDDYTNTESMVARFIDDESVHVSNEAKSMLT